MFLCSPDSIPCSARPCLLSGIEPWADLALSGRTPSAVCPVGLSPDRREGRAGRARKHASTQARKPASPNCKQGQPASQPASQASPTNLGDPFAAARQCGVQCGAVRCGTYPVARQATQRRGRSLLTRHLTAHANARHVAPQPREEHVSGRLGPSVNSPDERKKKHPAIQYRSTAILLCRHTNFPPDLFCSAIPRKV